MPGKQRIDYNNMDIAQNGNQCQNMNEPQNPNTSIAFEIHVHAPNTKKQNSRNQAINTKLTSKQ